MYRLDQPRPLFDQIGKLGDQEINHAHVFHHFVNHFVRVIAVSTPDLADYFLFFYET